MGKLVAIAILAAACGRFGFADHPGETPDATTIDSPHPDAPPGISLLSCGGPARLDVPVANVTAGLAAVSTTNGYAVFGVDANGKLQGWSFAFDGGTLTPVASAVPFDSNATGPIAGIGIGADLLLAEETGRPTATGTQLIPLDGHLASLGMPSSRVGAFFGLAPLAQSGSASDLTYLSGDAANLFQARNITALGADTGTVATVIDSAEGSTWQEILPGGPGYIATWTTSTTTPNMARMALLDNQFNVVAGPISTTGIMDALAPRAVWAKNANVYLLIWHEKRADNGDDTYFEVRDSQLQLVGTQTLAQTSAFNAVAASDGDGFLVAWDNYVPGDHMGSVYIDKTGAMAPRSVLSTGGKPTQWAMTERYGQPALVWLESGGSGPNLYIDPVCN